MFDFQTNYEYKITDEQSYLQCIEMFNNLIYKFRDSGDFNFNWFHILSKMIEEYEYGVVLFSNEA